MKVKSNGRSAAFFKRKAKNLKKQLGISHTEALNLISKEQGHPDWDSISIDLLISVDLRDVPDKDRRLAYNYSFRREKFK